MNTGLVQDAVELYMKLFSAGYSSTVHKYCLDLDAAVVFMITV